MKITTLLETNTTPSSDPAANQSQQAPKFGRDPHVLEDEQLDEMTAGATGSVATVAQPIGGVQRRGKGSMLQGIKTSKKFPNSTAVKEGAEQRQQNALWAQITDYEKRAKATKNDIKKAHYMKMASELRSKLKTNDEQWVAEGLSKRDQKDVAAIRAAIERLQAQLKQPNADKAAIQQSIEHEKKRLALYKQGVAEGIPDVDHMNGPRGINLPSADTRDILQKTFEIYGNYEKWYRDVNRVNSELLDDNAEFSTMSGGKIISINGEDFAFWSNRNGNGSIDIGIAKKHSGQGVAEGSDGWIGNPAKWKEAVLQAHGPDVVFKNYSHPGQPGKRSVNAINAAGQQVGVYQRHNKMGMVQPNMQGVAEAEKKPHPKTWHDVDPKLGRAADKMSQAEKVKKGLAHPDTLKKKGVAEGSLEEQVYKVVALDKSNALAKPVKLKVKASSIEDVFSRLAINDWYALSINGVEVVAGKRLKQGVAEEKQRLDPKCWDGYKKQGTKMKGDTRVNNCVPMKEAEKYPEPEQEVIDATRRARLQREREPQGSEKIDAMLAQRNAQLQQYTETGKFWLKKKDTQEHISNSYVGKAAANQAALQLLRQHPELKGNIVITAWGPGETPVNEAELSEEQLLVRDLKKQLELFKQAMDHDLGKKPRDKELGKKPKDKEFKKK